jgi:hypothetical protein
MIVKDEAHIITELLECIYKYIHYYVICDTGSTDDTILKIQDFFKDKNIKGEIHNHAWKNFGHNRSIALKECIGKSDYIWTIDADDLVVGDINFNNLTEDCYYLRIKSATVYWRRNLFKNYKQYKWWYEGVLHEHPDTNIPNCTSDRLEGDYSIQSRRKGSRSADPDKYKKDAIVFEEALKDEPKNSRYVFYLAQSYFDSNNYEKSLENYIKRTEMGNFKEEIFYSYYRIGLCKLNLKFDWEDTEKAFLKAYKHSEHRMEPIYQIMLHYKQNNEFIKAYKYAKIGCDMEYPNHSILFNQKDFYDWRVHYDMVNILCALERYYEAYIKAINVSKLPDLPNNITINIDDIKNVIKTNKPSLYSHHPLNDFEMTTDKGLAQVICYHNSFKVENTNYLTKILYLDTNIINITLNNGLSFNCYNKYILNHYLKDVLIVCKNEQIKQSLLENYNIENVLIETDDLIEYTKINIIEIKNKSNEFTFGGIHFTNPTNGKLKQYSKDPILSPAILVQLGINKSDDKMINSAMKNINKDIYPNVKWIFYELYKYYSKKKNNKADKIKLLLTDIPIKIDK